MISFGLSNKLESFSATIFAKSIVLTFGFRKSPRMIFTLSLAARSVKSPLCAIASTTFIVPFVTDTTPGFFTSPITITLWFFISVFT